VRSSLLTSSLNWPLSPLVSVNIVVEIDYHAYIESNLYAQYTIESNSVEGVSGAQSMEDAERVLFLEGLASSRLIHRSVM
jgi:hypothetical protein